MPAIPRMSADARTRRALLIVRALLMELSPSLLGLCCDWDELPTGMGPYSCDEILSSASARLDAHVTPGARPATPPHLAPHDVTHLRRERLRPRLGRPPRPASPRE